MAVNLVSHVLQLATPDLISAIAGTLGLDRFKAQRAIAAGIPAILAGFAQTASKPQSLQQVSEAMIQQSAVLDQSRTAIVDGDAMALARNGAGLLSSLLGAEALNTITAAVGRFAGLDPATGKPLLGLLAPLVAGVVGQQQRSAGLNAEGLANLLTSQSGQITAAMPPDFASLLGGTGLLDDPADGWRRDAAAAWSAAAGLADRPAYAPAGAGHLAQARATSASSSHWPWLAAGLAALLGLGLYVASDDDGVAVAERPLTPSTRASETTGASVPDQRLTDIAAELTASVSATRSALQGIADPASARAALPKLQQMTAQLDTINNAMSQLPPKARKGIASVVTRSMPMLNQLFDRVLAQPQTAELTRPTIDTLRTKLDALAKS